MTLPNIRCNTLAEASLLRIPQQLLSRQHGAWRPRDRRDRARLESMAHIRGIIPFYDLKINSG